MKRFYLSARVKLMLALGASSISSVALYFIGAWRNHDGAFEYLPWNLMLAWLALAAALWLERTLRHSLWSSWYAMAVTFLWLVFLPNTFYMISDFIHIQEVARVDLLYDVVMFTSFIFNGVVLGFLSLYLVHREFSRRFSAKTSYIAVSTILFLCSFAIYIGRDLRWNTWDIFTNPTSLIFDISDRVLNPHAHPQAFTTTLSFFVLLMSLYAVLWHVARVARQQRDT